jgi:DNA-3-methyladenine glycosylase
MKIPRPLPLSFYQGETVLIARSLLGCILWRRLGEEFLAVRIVETEAYLGANDPASHARGGLRSKRNETMYRAGGHAYVYFTYGMHHCMNVVTAEDGIAEAVLLRAGEPVAGIEAMRARRPAARKDTDLTSGPAKLCQALDVDRSLDGVSLRGPEVTLTRRTRPVSEDQIGISSRIGVGYAGEAAEWPLRFFLKGSPYVSRSR